MLKSSNWVHSALGKPKRRRVTQSPQTNTTRPTEPGIFNSEVNTYNQRCREIIPQHCDLPAGLALLIADYAAIDNRWEVTNVQSGTVTWRHVLQPPSFVCLIVTSGDDDNGDVWLTAVTKTSETCSHVANRIMIRMDQAGHVQVDQDMLPGRHDSVQIKMTPGTKMFYWVAML